MSVVSKKSSGTLAGTVSLTRWGETSEKVVEKCLENVEIETEMGGYYFKKLDSVEKERNQTVARG